MQASETKLALMFLNERSLDSIPHICVKIENIKAEYSTCLSSFNVVKTEIFVSVHNIIVIIFTIYISRLII